MALTRQYQVVPSAKSDVGVNVEFNTSKPASFQEVLVCNDVDSKVEDVSNWIAHPPTLAEFAKDQDSVGLFIGVWSTPEPIDHEPLSGVSGTGSEGTALEPGT